MAKKSKIESFYKVDYLRQTLVLKKDRSERRSCLRCILERPSCGDICLCAGPSYRVWEITVHPWYVVILRYFRHLFYKHYLTPIF